jgi:hypothetical protein
MMSHADKRLFVLVVLVFGIGGAAAGIRWLAAGNIVIRQGASRMGAGGAQPRPAPQRNAPVAGSIEADNVLYYPLCGMWVGLGVAMVALAVLSYFGSNEWYLRLSSYSCLAILLLAGATVAAALWSGP